MSLKNPLRPLDDTPKNRKRLESLSQNQWDDLSNAQKLSRIALCKKIGDFSLIKFEYDLEQIIKNYNIDKNASRDRNKQNSEVTIRKLEEDLKTHQVEHEELMDDMEEVKLERKKYKNELKLSEHKIKKLENEIKKLNTITQEKSNSSNEDIDLLNIKLKDSEAKIDTLKAKISREKCKEYKTFESEYLDCKSLLEEKDNEIKLLKAKLSNITTILSEVKVFCWDKFQELSDEINQ